MVGVERTAASIWEAEINNIHPSPEAYEKLKVLASAKGLDVLKLIKNPFYYVDEYQRFVEKDCPKKIRYIRHTYGLFTTQFSELIGLIDGGSSVSMWESGITIPLRKNFSRLRNLAEAKGIDISKLNDNPDQYKDDYSKFIEKDVDKKIAYIRHKAGLFQEEMGKQMGCSGNAISEWEWGNCIPQIDSFQLIKSFANRNGIDLEYLNTHPEAYQDPYNEFKKVENTAQRLRDFRKRCGLSMSELGKIIGVSSTRICQWENPQKSQRPGRKTFDRIMELATERGVEI